MKPSGSDPPPKPQTFGEALAERFHVNLPLIGGVFAAYICGSLHLGLFSALVIIWAAYFFVLVRADKQAHIEYKKYIEEDEKQKQRIEYESGEWLNILLKRMWPHVSGQWARSIRNSLTWSLGNYVSNSKSMLKAIEVKGVDLGRKAPRITAVSGLKAPVQDFDYRLDADIVYFGEATVRLEVTVGSGPITINVPVTIDELYLKGKMRFDMKFRDRNGTFRAIATSFRTAPQIGFRIRLAKSFDLMDLPAFKDMLVKAVNESIKFYMVDPKSYVYDFGASRQPTSASAANVTSVRPDEDKPQQPTTTQVPLSTEKPSSTAPSLQSQPSQPAQPVLTTQPTQPQSPPPTAAQPGTAPAPSSSPTKSSSIEQARPVQTTPAQRGPEPAQATPTVRVPPLVSPRGDQSQSTQLPLVSPRNASSNQQVPSVSPRNPPPPSSAPVSAKKAKPKLGFSTILRTLEGAEEDEPDSIAEKRRRKQLSQQKKKRSSTLTEDDAEFVVVKPPEIDGTLTVRVVEAAELHSNGIFSCDPYIVVECGGATHKTDTCDSTSNPHWSNAEFEFSIAKNDNQNMKLFLRAFDHDLVGDDTKIGRAEIDLSSIIKRHEEELLDLWIPLTDTPSGRVHVQLTYYPEFN